jgi:hypothetical protein
MSNANDRLRARVDSFVTELSDLVRHGTLGEIVDALKNAEGSAPAHRGGPPAKIAKARGERKVAGGTPGRSATAPIAAAQAGRRRAPELLAPLMARVHGYIKAHAGHGVGPIAAALGTSTRDLGLVLRKLLHEKKVTSTGKKRGTRYFPQ